MSREEFKVLVVGRYKLLLESARNNVRDCENQARDANHRLDAARWELVEAESTLRLAEGMTWEE